MFAALGRLASRRPWYVIAAWIVLTVLVVAFDHADGAALSTADVAKIREIAKGLTVGSAFSTIEDPIVGKGNEAAIVNIDLADGVTGQKQSDLDQVKGLRDQITTAAQD